MTCQQRDARPRPLLPSCQNQDSIFAYGFREYRSTPDDLLKLASHAEHTGGGRRFVRLTRHRNVPPSTKRRRTISRPDEENPDARFDRAALRAADSSTFD